MAVAAGGYGSECWREISRGDSYGLRVCKLVQAVLANVSPKFKRHHEKSFKMCFTYTYTPTVFPNIFKKIFARHEAFSII